jgi:phosphoribosylformylglycinamidine synthase subunit PurSL
MPVAIKEASRVQEIRVARKTRDIEGIGLRAEVKQSLGFDPGDFKTVRGYWIEGITSQQADTLRDKLLVDPVIQRPVDKGPRIGRAIRVAYKPGVMDPEADSIMEAAEALGIKPEAVSTYWEYQPEKRLSRRKRSEITDKLLVNKTVQALVKETPDTLVITGNPAPVEVFDVASFSDKEFEDLVKKKGWSLDKVERDYIREYAHAVGRTFTDVELGTIDQTWSEHCGHPTFNADIIVDGVKKEPFIDRIKKTSLEFGQNIVSAFKDNAGVILFYDGIAICAKGETHNSPVALEPYGGAMTRTGGVLRDISGLGEGGENLFNFDINCFAPPDLPKKKLPPGCHSPMYLIRNNFKGIRDYGNRMGIPTVSAGFFFHPDFAAKCTSLGITFGIIPEDRAQKKEPKAGQILVSVGGRTGRDGVGGATFASREMTDESLSVDSVRVQIGHPIEEKRTFDALIDCRDANLIGAITDCGGGGYSSAIGEIARGGGVEVWLDDIPTKYEGLSDEELWLSESQERMIVAVDLENIQEMKKIMKKHNVEMTVMGRFTGDRRLVLRHGEKTSCDLDMDFLHTQPQKTLEAAWPGPVEVEEPKLSGDWTEAYKQVLGDWNVCSQESVIRQYDHGVQALTALAPFTGVHEDVLNDGYVCKPIRGKKYGFVAAYGFNPILNRIDPYKGSQWAVAEALSKYTAVGGDYRESALIDNFIWPSVTKRTLGSLDRSVDGLCDAMRVFKIPCVSGKDSLSSTYKRIKKIAFGLLGAKEEVVEIPPVLNMSVFGRIPDAEKTTSVDFKRTDSTICLVGNLQKAPDIDLNALPQLFVTVQKGIGEGKILSCHAISRGGVGTALAHMCFGGDCGAKVDFSVIGGEGKIFDTATGAFLAEFASPEEAEAALAGVPHAIIGKTQAAKEIAIEGQPKTANIYDLKQAWQAPMKGVI